jgi:hypothetical protein
MFKITEVFYVDSVDPSVATQSGSPELQVCLPPSTTESDFRMGGVSLCHRGGRIQKINAWYLNTHMVYL